MNIIESLYPKTMMMEIFIPNKRIPIKATIVDSTNEVLNEYRELYSGKKNIYTSVYRYDKEINLQNVIIDKIFLDFDYDEDLKFFDDVRKVAKFLADSNYIFNIRFSGKGFHIFIRLNRQIQLKNPKQAIRRWVQDMHEKTETDSDHAVIGDLRRVSRMLGSMNLKTHLYCIPIEYGELMNFTYESIRDMAKEMKDEYIEDIFYIGGNFLDISSFDVEDKPKTINYNINIDTIKVQDGYPPCVEEMLKNPELGYWGRGQLIVFLRDDGYSFEEIIIILKSVLSDDKFYHCTTEEGQPAYLYYNREDMLFASCDTLKMNGFCTSNSCNGCHLYL